MTSGFRAGTRIRDYIVIFKGMSGRQYYWIADECDKPIAPEDMTIHSVYVAQRLRGTK